MIEDYQSRRTRLVSASILIVAAVVVSILYFTLPPTWLTQLCELLFFPAIAAIAGGLAIVWAGELVVNRWLERYKERSGYGLAKRKVFFSGDDEMIRDVRNDLLLSDLINRKNYTDPNIDLHDADIAILCISKDDGPAQKRTPINRGPLRTVQLKKRTPTNRSPLRTVQLKNRTPTNREVIRTTRHRSLIGRAGHGRLLRQS